MEGDSIKMEENKDVKIESVPSETMDKPSESMTGASDPAGENEIPSKVDESESKATDDADDEQKIDKSADNDETVETNADDSKENAEVTTEDADASIENAEASVKPEDAQEERAESPTGARSESPVLAEDNKSEHTAEEDDQSYAVIGDVKADADAEQVEVEALNVAIEQNEDKNEEDTPPPPPPDTEPPAEEPPSYNDVQEDDRQAEEDAPSVHESEPESEPEVKPEVVVSVTPPHGYHPRLCLIRKWPDFQGYGFNLHAEKDKPGQYIGLVDANSPAEDADLRKGDRIIEVNGDNIEESTHHQVIQQIKAGGEETLMLVVDNDADDYYKNNGIRITADLPEVVVNETKPREAPAMTSHSNHPRLCHIVKWPDFQGYGFNLHAEKERGGQYIGKIDDNSPAQEAGLKENDRIIEVNDNNVESETHQQVISRIKAGGDETSLLVVDREADAYYKSKGITVTSSLPETKSQRTSPRTPKPAAVTNGDSYSAPAPTRVEPAKSAPAPQAQANGGGDFLSMNLSAKEMRERIAQKKRNDPKHKSNMDFKSKYEIFQKM